MILAKKIVRSSILLVISLVIEICCKKYEFKTEMVQRVRYGAVDQEVLQKNHLSQMKYDDWKTLCNEVREFSSLQFLPNYEYYLFGAKASEIENMGKKVPHLIGYCPTIPEVYLRLGDTENMIVLMFELTLADLYEYDIDPIKSITEAKLSEKTQKELEKHVLFTLDHDTRWKFCIAAQRKFKNLILTFALVKVKIYHIVESSNDTLDRPGFECPTSPIALYMRLGDVENKMIIMFVNVNDEIVV